ncbi:MAG: putative membrane protein YdjX (TVP38/TMEM64 family) [Verrucomicrobiales bacterium]|jgi:uncharacterized membrane protein YdjX (TVP38/TMEM64 family)
MRLLWLFFALACIVLATFAIWGDAYESQFTIEGSLNWLQKFGEWAWIAAIALLAADIFLPIPSTVIFTALGILYGPLWGGLIGTAGFAIGGGIAYGLCRSFGERPALWLLGEKDYRRGRSIFSKSGGWIIVLSRWLPVLPEVISCMAGLAKMPVGKFLTALLCGSAPIAFAFAALGHAGKDQPLLPLLASVIIAPLLWLGAAKWLRARHDDQLDGL